MKWALVLILMPLLLQAADEEGAWSNPVQGLRGRLLISPSQEPELDKTFDVIIEFQEVGIETSLGKTHRDITVRFSQEDPSCSVADANGHAIPPMSPLDMDMLVRMWDLVLPEKGRLTFPIGAGGRSYPGQAQPAGMPLRIGLIESWIIPTSGGPYYLSGTLTVARDTHPFTHEEPYRGWTGTLVLPPVKLPEK